MEKNSKPEMVPFNHRHFVLTYTDNPEDYAFTKEEVIDMLNIVAENEDHESFYDPEFTNNVGTFFEGGVCVEKDIKKAVFWYERAVALGNDLAKSNLADILRKGSEGYPKDLKRAFELYKSCGLPYAFYRMGEFYENGWGVEKNLDLAKEYFRVAYQEKHPLAIRKLREFDFLH